MSRPYTATHTIERDGVEIEVKCRLRHYPASRGHCDSFGAQEEPDEPETIELEAAWLLNGEPFELTDEETEKIQREELEK